MNSKVYYILYAVLIVTFFLISIFGSRTGAMLTAALIGFGAYKVHRFYSKKETETVEGKLDNGRIKMIALIIAYLMFAIVGYFPFSVDASLPIFHWLFQITGLALMIFSGFSFLLLLFLQIFLNTPGIHLSDAGFYVINGANSKLIKRKDVREISHDDLCFSIHYQRKKDKQMKCEEFPLSWLKEIDMEKIRSFLEKQVVIDANSNS